MRKNNNIKKMSGLGIALIIFGILIFIGIIIVVILVAVGVFESEQITEILSGTFSVNPINDSSKHVTTSNAVTGKVPAAKDTLVLSNSTTVKCDDYGWTFKNNFLELGTTGLVAEAASTTTGTPITLVAKGTASTSNQWEYIEEDIRWCLKSNTNLCIFNNSNKLVLQNGSGSFNEGFGWLVKTAITSPTCTT